MCYDSVKWTFVKWSIGCQTVRHSSTINHKRNWNRDAYYSQVLDGVHCTLKGPCGAVRAECRQRAVGPEVHLYQGLWAECFGVPRPRLCWSTQTKRVRFGELHRDLSRSTWEKVLGDGGDITRAIRELILGTYIFLWLWRLLSKVSMWMRKVGTVSGPWKPLGHTK